jgi:hypothetical protein
LIDHLLPVPDGILLRTRQHSDRLSQLGVGWQSSVRSAVSAQDVRQ